MKDKLEQHHGLQLSALMDGELAPDEARFLLRRLQHDGELAACWERWQLAGDVLRGRTGALLPGGFADRVGLALRAEAAPVAPRRRPGLLRWGGVAALAASVAVVALMVPRPDAPGVEPHVAATASSGAPMPSASEPPVAEPRVPAVIEAPAAEPSRVAAGATAAGGSSARVASRRAPALAAPAAPAVAPPRATTTPEPAGDALAAARQLAARERASEPERAPRDPFSDAPLVSSRPWPRAVLPQFGNGGALATGLPGNDGAQAPSFYPFEPRLPEPVPEPVPEPAGEPASGPPHAPY